MNTLKERLIACGVAAALFAVLSPGNATVTAPRLLIAMAGAVVAFFVTSTFLARRRQRELTSSQGGRVKVTRDPSRGLWGLFRLTCAASLVLGTAGVALRRLHVVGLDEALSLGLLGAQLPLVVFAWLVATRRTPDIGFGFRAAYVIAAAGVAGFLALVSDSALLIPRLPAELPFHGFADILFAIPALLAGSAGLVFRSRTESRQ